MRWRRNAIPLTNNFYYNGKERAKFNDLTKRRKHMSYKAAVISVGSSYSDGAREAEKLLCEIGFDIIYTSTVPHERYAISEEFIKCEYELEANLIVSCGGTGLSHKEVTPEATLDVVDREIPAIPQAMLHYSLQITPRAMLTRAVAGVRNNTLIINLPGSAKAVRENLTAISDALYHAVQMLS